MKSPASKQRLRIEYVELGWLLARFWPGNPKLHDLEELAAAYNDRGFVEPVIFDDKTGKVVAGHGRLEELEELRKAGAPAPDRIEVRGTKWFVPVVRGVAFKDVGQARRHVLASNKLVESGGYDDKLLIDLLTKIGNTAEDLAGTGVSEKELVQFLAHAATEDDKQKGATDPDAVPELPKKARSRTGDLYLLGEHRLLCGDSTIEADVRRLMGKDRAVLMATDPPYGVEYTDDVRVASDRAHVRKQREQKWEVAIDNDDKTGADIQPFLEAVFRAAVAAALDKKAAWYLWHAQMTQGFFAAAAAAAAKLILHRQIIWVKPTLLFGFGDYHWRHELCFYGWIQGNRPPFYGERNQTTVWEITNETSNANRVHPTQKPVQIFEIPMNNHVKTGGICYEPFSGSGSQIIAGQRLGRRVRAMEKDPIYVDVAVQRWEEFTGGKAKLQRA